MERHLCPKYQQILIVDWSTRVLTYIKVDNARVPLIFAVLKDLGHPIPSTLFA